MRRPIIVAGLLAAAAILGACSSQGPQPAPTAPPAEHGTYAHCLSEHGVPMAPGPVAGPPSGVDEQTWQQATKACSTLAPGPS
ncbi:MULTISPECIES: hypothetical protein [Mycolicibacterium]|jgi:hypothetical protein|uniref:Lipoprotein n=3 Tax=Mycolicibacterium fortuitum TaxID=1766 RepID=A0A0N9Y5R4_MYCFO|nr:MULTISPECIES: hypothetical protein [Mycolicibacterium]AIY45099.1 hypothetical protein G155_05395 [Mycobacterium sp. VKM Ac-1817D]MDO3239600.1 hypothetical protein [Mycobacteroides abscessus subsp. abscessus]CRL80288.1 hypothetical protein CPGR_03486 [Mycolicibacter nonchromogenicus]ALI24902.1 hypothetical protein XA26_10450 [Mycolicibacterium fortuitum]AMD54033.1 hypothetical protein ATO49_04965 [Mycolicibacterium fortuitum subsp. fortuitum DSM 46621 = ATCC 6841 = JCM 6387]